MSLVPEYDDSSDSTSSSDADNSKTEENRVETSFKLPTPDFEGKSIEPDNLKYSVFTNPFIEAENAKEAILQKHVKMVDTKDVVVINGKKVCWNYRKGRCRFGHNCKFAHDSDIQKTKEQIESENETARQHSVVCQKGVTGFAHTLPQPPKEEINHVNGEHYLDNKQKRKRPGLTQGLVPGKKVLKNYMNQKIT